MKQYTLTLLLTQSCNMECKYCFTYDNGKNEKIDKYLYLEHTITKIREILNTYPELEYLTIEFFGGEPLINFYQIESMLPYLYSIDPRIKFKICTNLLLMDIQKYLILKQYNTEISFSFDGEWTDIQRPQVSKKSALARYIDMQPEIVKYNLGACHTMIYPAGLKKCSILSNYLWIKRGFNLEPDFNIVRDNNIWNKEDTSLLIYRLMEFYTYITCGQDPDQKLPTIFKRPIQKIINYKAKGYKADYCGILKSKTLISPSLKEYPCNAFLGNSQTLEPGELINKLDFALNNSACSTCSIKDYCDKGCPAQIMNNPKQIGQEDNLCTIFKALHEIGLKLLQYAQDNPISSIAIEIQKIFKEEGLL